MVLDIETYMAEHPGGQFSIEHNIGRDISKFFYGGYSLEIQDKVNEHRHSNDARKIVNSIAIGRLENPVNEQVMKIIGLERNVN